MHSPPFAQRLSRSDCLNTWSGTRRHLASASVPLERFLAEGLMEAQSLLVLDLDKCTRCDNCVRACADAHDGVTRLTREGVRFENLLVATSCRQCRDPLCMVGCPVGAIRRQQSLGSDYRRLVHRLRLMRQELPVRQYHDPPVPRDGDRCLRPPRRSPQTESYVLRSVYQSCGAQLRLRLPA